MKRAARAAPPSIGAAVTWAAKPVEVALEAEEPAAAVALEAPLERDEARDEAAPEMDEATDDPDADADDAAPEALDPAAPTAVKRVVEPTVEVVTALLPEETVVRIAAMLQLGVVHDEHRIMDTYR
jgi:hypothetical protein